VELLAERGDIAIAGRDPMRPELGGVRHVSDFGLRCQPARAPHQAAKEFGDWTHICVNNLTPFLGTA
jgi:hypothetical protein